jgi:hypothetical protein
MGVGRRADRLPAVLAALLLVLLAACGGTSAGAGSVSTGTASEATGGAATAGVASANVVATASTSPATVTAATTTAAVATLGSTASSSSSAVTTASPVAKLSAALSAASRLATSTATGSAGGGPVAEKLVFTGVVAGTVNSSPAPGDCGKKDIAPLDVVLHVFRFSAITAKLADGTYDFGLQIMQYAGPGTYGSGTKGGVILSVRRGDVEYLNIQDTDTTVVVVAPDEASGTVEADFSDPLGGNAKGHVSGSWRCR